MNLFEISGNQKLTKESPLAVRMRPRTLEEFIGQEHIVGVGKLLRRAIQADQLSSLIFYGPPGTGKTTLAKIIANSTKAAFEQINAVTAGIANIREVINIAKDSWNLYNKRTILFVDEIHRFNKGQQDALLPYVEDGTLILIGATTENPYFEVNSALLSRSRIFALKTLTDTDIKSALELAIEDVERGLGRYKIVINEDALNHIINMANGDARSALNALELAVLTTIPNLDGIRVIDLSVAEESIQQKAVQYDKGGDSHYDIISAFIKSMRGSDPQAALHWLARMLHAGEDPRFIARRIVICAAEDVGMADPQALVIAMTAAQALDYLGMPEARIPLAEAVVYIATAPKSNSAYLAINEALEDIERKKIGSVPSHLRDANYRGAKALGHGQGYKYPHNYPSGWIEQQYLPEELHGVQYYKPTNNGYEEKVKVKMIDK